MTYVLKLFKRSWVFNILVFAFNLEFHLFYNES